MKRLKVRIQNLSSKLQGTCIDPKKITFIPKHGQIGILKTILTHFEGALSKPKDKLMTKGMNSADKKTAVSEPKNFLLCAPNGYRSEAARLCSFTTI
jgi:hypothetical protein